MASLATIESPVWSLSTYGYGVIVQGLAAIRQRIDLVIRTTKGTDPLRPLFGSDVYKFVDAPENVAIPNIKKAILEALEIWVPEIKVTKINHSFETHYNPVFEITYRLVDEDLIDKIVLDLQEGITETDQLNEIILQAFFPPNPNNYRYQINLVINGSQATPLPDPSGFSTIKELYNWITGNWTYYGRWYLLSDKIVCYMKADGIKSASLGIEVFPIIRFEDDFPQIAPGEVYSVDFKVNGVDVNPLMPLIYNNPGDVLTFAKTYWGKYDWFISYIIDGNAVFENQFSSEFEIASTGYILIGISNEEGVTAELVITTTNA